MRTISIADIQITYTQMTKVIMEYVQKTKRIILQGDELILAFSDTTSDKFIGRFSTLLDEVGMTGGVRFTVNDNGNLIEFYVNTKSFRVARHNQQKRSDPPSYMEYHYVFTQSTTSQ